MSSLFLEADLLLKLTQLTEQQSTFVLTFAIQLYNEQLIDEYIPKHNPNVYFLECGAEGFDRFYENWRKSLLSKSIQPVSANACR